ncbi:MAG TPA: hypothetical protein VE967_18230 [Gemmatimonadaceae bacterium]|nr:hypothetical protein [Gemmatimonadaceae bacterium]
MKRYLSLAAAAMVAFAPLVARAQVGGLINKAKQAAQGQKSPTDAALGDPFDASSLDAALKGMRVYKTRTNDLAALRQQFLTVQNKRAELQNQNQRAIDAYESDASKIKSCISEQLSQSARANAGAIQQKAMSLATDATKMQQYSQIAQQAAAAAQKGDTAAMAKANADMMKLLGMDPHADTVAAQRKCGAVPARPAAMAEMDRLEKQSDTLSVRIRTGESTADIDAARAAGVTPAKFAQMRERLTSWLAKPGSFGAAETAVLKPRKAEIEDLTKTS